MLRAQQAGAVIMPAIPAFYHQPKTIDDLVTQYVCRVLAQIGLPQEEMYRWHGSAALEAAGEEKREALSGDAAPQTLALVTRISAALKNPGRIKIVLEMIKFEHSVFALPFALTGALLGARATHHGWPTLRQILWMIVAMVSARSAAMTINRIVDLRYDRENPRTKQRALATGALSVSFAWTFTLIAVAVFFVAAWQLNPLALKLAPLALAILFFYSFTKRFTTWSHLFLGFALGISPAAAWIAITGGFDPRMLILCAAVTLWVGGFDVLYACQDMELRPQRGIVFRFRSDSEWRRRC